MLFNDVVAQLESEAAVGSTSLEAGDQVLAILEPGKEDELRRVFNLGIGWCAIVGEAIGPVAGFSPWNFPVTQAVRKIAAARGLMSSSCACTATPRWRSTVQRCRCGSSAGLRSAEGATRCSCSCRVPTRSCRQCH